jgi:hypothetical protein
MKLLDVESWKSIFYSKGLLQAKPETFRGEKARFIIDKPDRRDNIWLIAFKVNSYVKTFLIKELLF